ncbi:ABC transporter permease [Pontibacter rugosus]|uniref:ABC transporter permease n=1 Tax=Pontibacter rugosus TaxID=1745966 RepID=A0ABW3SQ23_9BACT
MKIFRILIKYEWLNFRADKGLLILTTLILVAGLYGIYYGTTAIERQRENIAALDVLTEHNVEEMKLKFPGEADAGDIGYYHSTYAVNYPDSWASLSMGQRDVNPIYIKLRLLNLQSQLYDTDNVNPLKVLAGNFDLAFVLVYLFPLLIIGLCFNILSAEKEQGTLPLLLSQPISLPLVVGAKLTFRLMIVLGLALLLSVVAMVWGQVIADVRLFIWLSVVILYCLFWFGIAFVVAALQKNSAFNAVSLLGVWLLLTIIIPALLNVYVAVKQPVPQALDLTIKQREVVHGGWDKPKQETMKKFFALYPEWTDTTEIQGRFAWRWYYAFHHLGDVAVEALARDYKESLLARHKLVEELNLISPPVNVQGILNAMAGSDLPAHVAFLQSATAYHDALREFYYPFLFKQVAFTHADFNHEPKHSFTSSPDLATAAGGLLKLPGSVLVVFVAGLLLFRINKLSVQ